LCYSFSFVPRMSPFAHPNPCFLSRFAHNQPAKRPLISSTREFGSSISAA
jgi:hypothetical protein